MRYDLFTCAYYYHPGCRVYHQNSSKSSLELQPTYSESVRKVAIDCPRSCEKLGNGSISKLRNKPLACVCHGCCKREEYYCGRDRKCLDNIVDMFRTINELSPVNFYVCQ